VSLSLSLCLFCPPLALSPSFSFFLPHQVRAEVFSQVTSQGPFKLSLPSLCDCGWKDQTKADNLWVFWGLWLQAWKAEHFCCLQVHETTMADQDKGKEWNLVLLSPPWPRHFLQKTRFLTHGVLKGVKSMGDSSRMDERLEDLRGPQETQQQHVWVTSMSMQSISGSNQSEHNLRQH
jgi:hypothetical protein